jgi:aspartyl/asparaginyl-tRNA synthetase
MEIAMTDLKNFVVVAEHPPQLCPHSNAAAKQIMQRVPEIEAVAKKLEIEIVFSGIPVPEHQTIMILRAATFEAVRTFTVETHFVQINTVTIRQTESVEEFFNETKDDTPLF